MKENKRPFTYSHFLDEEAIGPSNIRDFFLLFVPRKQCKQSKIGIYVYMHMYYIQIAKKTFEARGYSTEQDIIYDDIRKVNICFLVKDGYRVELVSPVSEDSVVSGLIKKYKNSPYHICYETADFPAAYD